MGKMHTKAERAEKVKEIKAENSKKVKEVRAKKKELDAEVKKKARQVAGTGTFCIRSYTISQSYI